jgi:hypothetical protein
LTAAGAARYNGVITPREDCSMRTVTLSLSLLSLTAVPALAAPAPFTRPVPEPTDEVIVAQIKKLMLEQYATYADRVVRNDENFWTVVGNRPMAYDGELSYSRRIYRVTVTADRRGALAFQVYMIYPRGRVYTR